MMWFAGADADADEHDNFHYKFYAHVLDWQLLQLGTCGYNRFQRIGIGTVLHKGIRPSAAGGAFCRSYP